MTSVVARRVAAVALAMTVSGVAVAASPAPGEARPTLRAAVRDYLDTRSGVATVAVHDIVRDRTWWWRIHVRGYTASIVKVDILAALMRRYGALSEEQAELATRMIEYSDNDAASALYGEIGGASGLDAFDDAAGLWMTTENVAWGLTRTSAYDQIVLLERLAMRNRLLSRDQRHYALRLMRHVTPSQRWGVPDGVPDDVSVAVKNGWLPLSSARGGGWQVNSIGYVRGERRRYVIAVLTHSPSFAYGQATIRHVSALVWPYMWRVPTS